MPVSGRTLCCSVSGWRLGAAPLSAAAGPAVAFPWQLGVTGGLAGIRLGQWGRMLLVESHVFLAVRWFGIPFFCAEMLASARSQHLDKLTMLLASHSTIPKSIER